MLVLRNDRQATLIETLMPKELMAFGDELRKIDALLDDERFIGPFRRRFFTRVGRPTIPVEIFLRLMYLKHRYGLGYESLVTEVSDSIQWRCFCRIPLNHGVPHATTLIKLTRRYGTEVIHELNEVLVEKAREKKIVRGRKLRVDTTVVPSDIHHPTDASLLADGVRVITRTVKKIGKMGIKAADGFRDRKRSIRKRILLITKVLKRRSKETIAEVRNITQEVMTISERVATEAQKIVEYAEKSNAGKLANTLKTALAKTERIIWQTKEVQKGNIHIPERLISLFDDRARPIKKGKLNAPVEFGYKLCLSEAENSIITDYEVLQENPSDETLLISTVDRHIKRFGRPPRDVATDRGFSSAANEASLKQRGVRKISLPRKGKLDPTRKAYQQQGWFTRLQRWRAGGEATISLLKRKYGLNRSRLRGKEGTEIWVGWGIMACNLRRIGAKV